MRVRRSGQGCIFFVISMLSLLPLVALGQANQGSVLSAGAKFDSDLLDSVKIQLYCNQGEPQKREFVLYDGKELELPVDTVGTSATNCQIIASLPGGYSAVYSVDGPGAYVADEEGCMFARIASSQSNSCRIEVTQNPVHLVVYKKWIGASGEEADIGISLSCESGSYSGDRFINQGSPAGWKIRDIDPEGILCNVSEAVRDSFRPDILDCQGLLIIPGRDEECTMVNTKIVKRIEMLNRFGKIVMVVLVLAIGLVAVKRLS